MEGGDLNITLTSFPDYLDPQISYTLEGWEALYPSYTPLLTYAHKAGDEGAQVVPGLAKAMPEISDDLKTYTLELRDGLKYSDGSPVKASDFPFAVERMFDTDSGGSSFYTDITGAEDYADGKADSISGIQADDESGKITIHLDQPRGTFLNELALMFVAPVPQDTPKDSDQTNDPPPSTGPFMITEVDPGTSFKLVRNPEFVPTADIPDAHVDSITVQENKNNSSQVTDIEQNKTDFMVDPPIADRLPEVQSRFEDRFRFENSINTYYFWMNNQEPPFDDVKVRQAVNYALDPEALNRVFGGRLAPMQQVLPEGMPGHEEFTLYPGPDIEKAKELIAEANPSDMDITVWTDDEPDRKRLAEYYDSVLKELGFNTDLKIIDGAVYFSTIGNLKTPNLDTGFSDWFQDYPHPNDFFQPLLAGESIQEKNNQNFSQTDIPELNTKINELGQQLLSDTEGDYAALDRAYMEQAVWAPYGSEEFTTFVSDRMDFDSVIHHVLMNHDFTSFAIKG